MIENCRRAPRQKNLCRGRDLELPGRQQWSDCSACSDTSEAAATRISLRVFASKGKKESIIFPRKVDILTYLIAKASAQRQRPPKTRSELLLCQLNM